MKWVRAVVFFLAGIVVIAAATYLSAVVTDALDIAGATATIVRGVIVIGSLAVYVWLADRLGWRPDFTK